MENVIRFGICRIILASFFLCFAMNMVAQDNVLLEEGLKVSVDETDYEQAVKHINALNSGALIVRLRQNTKKVEAYRNAGNETLAVKLEEVQKEKNLEMLKAFKAQFDFCKVYFIYAEDYTKVLAGEKSGYFVNENLDKDPSIVLVELNFLFCDFGVAYGEAITNPINPLIKEITSAPVLQEALIIKNQALNQILSPFPTYFRVKLLQFEKAVMNLNANLFKFYSKSWAKKKKNDE